MACLGIPSLNTKGGAGTWPDLVELGMILEVDWNNLEMIMQIIEQRFRQPSLDSIQNCKKTIEVGRNLDILLWG
jgi:hypothetical protein